MSDAKELVQQAKFALKAERYEDTVAAMKKVVEMSTELSSEEQDLLSVAYKRVVCARLSAWSIIRSIEQMSQGSEKKEQMAKEYREKVELELQQICGDVLGLLDNILLPNAATAKSKMFYRMMKLEFSAYLAEIAPGEDASIALPCYIDSLPDPLLATIFAYLPHKERLRLSEVCSRWNAVTHLDWLDVIDLDLTPIPSPNIGAILRLSPNLESIFGLRRFLIMDDLTEHYQTNATVVKLYDVSMGLSSTTGDERHTNEYRNLLWFMDGENRQACSEYEFQAHRVCTIFHGNSPNEQNALDVFTSALNRWFEKLPQLEELVLHNLTITDLSQLSVTSIIPFSIRGDGQLTGLTRLQLSGSGMRQWFDPHLLSASLRQLQQLECLVLHLSMLIPVGDHDQTDRVFCDAVASLKNLRELSLAVIHRVDFGNGESFFGLGSCHITDIPFALPKLEVLFLFNVFGTREPLVKLLTVHPTLRIFLLSGHFWIHVDGHLAVPVRKFNASALAEPLPFLNVFLGAEANARLRFTESAAAKIFSIDVPMRDFLEKADVACVMSGVWVAEMVAETTFFDPYF